MSTLAPLYLDVRTPEEHAERSLGGSLNIPYDELEPRLAELGDTARTIFVYCRSGRRSAIAATTLARAGFAHVTDLASLEQAIQHCQEATS